jgi:hypothetical protein
VRKVSSKHLTPVLNALCQRRAQTLSIDEFCLLRKRRIKQPDLRLALLERHHKGRNVSPGGNRRRQVRNLGGEPRATSS